MYTEQDSNQVYVQPAINYSGVQRMNFQLEQFMEPVIVSGKATYPTKVTMTLLRYGIDGEAPHAGVRKQRGQAYTIVIPDFDAKVAEIIASYPPEEQAAKQTEILTQIKAMNDAMAYLATELTKDNTGEEKFELAYNLPS